MHLHQYLSGVYQSPRLDALHLHTLYIRVGRMNINKDKMEWMIHAQKLPVIQTVADSYRHEMEEQARLNEMSELERAITKTTRSILAGATLAAMDGPLPVLDVLGFGVGVVGTTLAWIDYFFLDD